MAARTDRLVWIDLEMSGLEPYTDRILEIATIVTDSDLAIVAEGPVLALRQPEPLLASMDEWNTRTHGVSGLLDRVRASAVDESEAQSATLAFVRRHVRKGSSPLCGNSVYQDRRFLHRYMPELENHLHYRNLDVSTVKELVRRWYPEVYDGFRKKNAHRALDDIRESIAELAYYREQVFSARSTGG